MAGGGGECERVLRVLAVAEEPLRPGFGVAAKPLHVDGRVFHRVGRAAQVLVLLSSDPRQVVVDLQSRTLLGARDGAKQM